MAWIRIPWIERRSNPCLELAPTDKHPPGIGPPGWRPPPTAKREKGRATDRLARISLYIETY